MRLTVSKGRWAVSGIQKLWREYKAQGHKVAGISYSEFRRRLINRLKCEIVILEVRSDVIL